METLDKGTKAEEYLCMQADRNKIPLSTAFELLPLCNMNCEMCYIRMSREELARQGRIGSADEWLHIAEEMKEAGTLFVLLTGGEPMMHPQFWEIYRGLRSMGMVVTINSNGTLIGRGAAERFASDLPRRVNITLYGADNDTYSRLCRNPHGFEQAMAGIRLLKERQVPVKLNASIVPENKEDLPKLLQIADDLDLPIEVNTYMFPCIRNGRNAYDPAARLSFQEAADCDIQIRRWEQKERFAAYAGEILKKWERAGESPAHSRQIVCRAGKSSCWINWKREMTPCVFMEQPAVPISGGKALEGWRQIVAACAGIQLAEACGTCPKREICQRCAAAAYWETGEFGGVPEYLCRYTDEVIRRLNEICRDAEAAATCQ